MNDTERDLINRALGLLFKAKYSMRYRAMGGRNGAYETLTPMINAIIEAELSLEPLIDPVEEEVEV